MKITILAIKNDKPEGWIIADSIEEAARRAEAARLPGLAQEVRGFTDPADGRYLLSESRWMLVQRSIDLVPEKTKVVLKDGPFADRECYVGGTPSEVGATTSLYLQAWTDGVLQGALYRPVELYDGVVTAEYICAVPQVSIDAGDDGRFKVGYDVNPTPPGNSE